MSTEENGAETPNHVDHDGLEPATGATEFDPSDNPDPLAVEDTVHVTNGLEDGNLKRYHTRLNCSKLPTDRRDISPAEARELDLDHCKICKRRYGDAPLIGVAARDPSEYGPGTVFVASGPGRGGVFHTETCCNFPDLPAPWSREMAEDWGYEECDACKEKRGERDRDPIGSNTDTSCGQGGECPFCGENYTNDLPSHLRDGCGDAGTDAVNGGVGR